MSDDGEKLDVGEVHAMGGKIRLEDAEVTDPLPFARFDALAGAAFDRFERRSRGEEVPIPLPWRSVGEALGGPMHPGLRHGLHVLVGNTKSGKSQLAMQVALHAAKEQVPVLYVALELGADDLVARVAGLHTGKKWSRLWLGEDAREIGHVREEVARDLSGIPLYFEVASPYAWQYRELEQRAAAFRATHAHLLDGQDGMPRKPFLLVLDFLQVIASAEGEREELRQRIQNAAYHARDVARKLTGAVLLVSSTAREHYRTLEGRAPKNTTKKDHEPLGEGAPDRLVGLGKESGEIEFAADTVLVLGREPWEGERPEWSRVWLAVAGARARESSWARLMFNGGRFREPDERELKAWEARQREKRQDGNGSNPPAPSNSEPYFPKDAY